MGTRISALRLSDGEKEVLRLFLSESDPKKIASTIGKSPHEVKRRFDSAREKLGVSSTALAADLLALEEDNPTYLTAIYGRLVRSEDRGFDLIRPPSDGGHGIARYLPFPRRGRPWNAQPGWSRLLGVLVMMLLLIIAAMMMVGFAEGLSTLGWALHWTERTRHEGLFSQPPQNHPVFRPRAAAPAEERRTEPG